MAPVWLQVELLVFVFKRFLKVIIAMMPVVSLQKMQRKKGLAMPYEVKGNKMQPKNDMGKPSLLHAWLAGFETRGGGRTDPTERFVQGNYN